MLSDKEQAAALKVAENNLGHRHAEPGCCFACTNLAGLILAQRRAAVEEDRAKVSGDAVEGLAQNFADKWAHTDNEMTAMAKDLAAVIARYAEWHVAAALDKTAQPPIKRCPRCGGELYGTSSAMGGPTEWWVCRCGYEEEVIRDRSQA